MERLVGITLVDEDGDEMFLRIKALHTVENAGYRPNDDRAIGMQTRVLIAHPGGQAVFHELGRPDITTIDAELPEAERRAQREIDELRRRGMADARGDGHQPPPEEPTHDEPTHDEPPSNPPADPGATGATPANGTGTDAPPPGQARVPKRRAPRKPKAKA